MIVIKRSDGGVSVMRLAPGADAATEIAKWPVAQQASVVSFREMTDDAEPADRYFRDAWCDTTPDMLIDHDMQKCVDIHKNVLRSMRAPKFEPLDVAYLRAVERGDEVAKVDIVAKKNALRDVTADPRIAAAKTPEELKAIIPAELLA